MKILELAVAIAIGTLLISLSSRWIGRVNFTLSNAFCGSALGHIVLALVGLALSFLLHAYWDTALIIYFLGALIFLTVLFRLIARAQNMALGLWRAAVIAVIVVAGDFLIASPIMALIQHGTRG